MQKPGEWELGLVCKPVCLIREIGGLKKEIKTLALLMLREVERGPLHARLVANGKSRKSLDLFWATIQYRIYSCETFYCKAFLLLIFRL